MQKEINKLIALFLFSMVMGCNPVPGDFIQGDEPPELYPDYTSLTVPYNIAPLNFQILNKGDQFVAEISNSLDRRITVRSTNGRISFPLESWKKLLNEDRGGALTISVYKKNR